MNFSRAIERKAQQNAASLLGKITGPSVNGFNLLKSDGVTEVKGVASPFESSWPDGTWVYYIQAGGGYSILGRASNAPTNDLPG